MMSEKEKRKNEVAAKPRYVLLPVLSVVALVYVLEVFFQELPIYPLKIIPNALTDVLLKNLTILNGWGIIIIYCILIIIAIRECKLPWLDRIVYILANTLMMGFIFVMIFWFTWLGYKHDASIQFDNQVYHLAHYSDADFSHHYLYICDATGIFCLEDEKVGGVDLGKTSLQISADGKSIEVIEIAGDGSFHVIDTYTPEISGTE